MGVDLTDPRYLGLLAFLPLVVVTGLRSLAGQNPVRAVLVVVMRCLVLVTMTLALAGLEGIRTTDDQAVIFALDQSDSVPPDLQQAAERFVVRAADGMRPGRDQVAALSFAGRPSVAQLPGPSLITDRFGPPALRHQTDLAAALRLSLALYPPDVARRLVLLSDGLENQGLAAREAETYAALGIPIDVVPLCSEHQAEFLVEQLAAPATAERGETITLTLIVRSQVDTRVRLMLYRNDRPVDLDPNGPDVGATLQLAVGANRFSIPFVVDTPGVQRFRAMIEPVDPALDAIALNNRGEALTIVGDPNRVLIVVDPNGSDPRTDFESAEILASVLREAGLSCECVALEDLPGDPSALAGCAAVVLSNVSAYGLGETRQAMLASYVRDQGGGLVVLGGDQAFSVGGYAHTPLEAILPVETNRDVLKVLSLSLVIVIDRSGSMLGEKIEMARQAAAGALQLLSRLDRVGVIAFDTAWQWVVPLTPCEDKPSLLKRIAMLGAGGGTDMYPAFEQAYAGLVRESTSLKHVILLTDGQTARNDFEGLARRCGEAGITVSTIAIGPDADRDLLGRIAELSGGRTYVTDSARPLPQIFVRETVLASRSGLFEKTFTPQRVPVLDDQVLRGFTQADLPPLDGYVITAAKPLANVPLVRPHPDGRDPILAYWQVGLGRTLAFTSGMWPRWGSRWVSWSGFGKLWTQAVRYVARAGRAAELEVETAVRGGQARVSISAEHLPGHAQETLMLTGRLIGPNFSSSPVPLYRTAAGRFEASFPLDVPGAYLLNLFYGHGSQNHRQRGSLQVGVVQSYSPEYRTLRADQARLIELARLTGGRVLDVNHPEAVFEKWSIRPVQVRRPYWEDLLRLALVLFLLDVAVRRLAIAPAEALAGLRRFLHDLAGRGQEAEATETLGSLRRVKAKVRTVMENPPGEPAGVPGDFGPQRASPASLREDPLVRMLNELDADRPVVTGPERPTRPESGSEQDYTGRLLQAKLRARRRAEDRETP